MGNRFGKPWLAVLAILLMGCPQLTTPDLPDIQITQDGVDVPNNGTVDLGSVVADGSGGTHFADVVFTVNNTGGAVLSLVFIDIDEPDFYVADSASTTVGAGSATAFTLRFDPQTAGAKAGRLTIGSDDPDEPSYVVSLTGTGAAAPVADISVSQDGAEIDSGEIFDFGAVVADGNGGTHYTDTVFTIHNNGDALLTLGSANIDVPDFYVSAAASPTVAPGTSTDFTLRFDPQTTGDKTGFLTIASDDPDQEVYELNLVGVGAAAPVPEINVRQGGTDLVSGTGSYSYGSVLADGNNGTASGYTTFTIQNLGSAALTLTSTAISGSDFDLTAPLSNSIGAGSSTTFTVRFDPLVAGNRSATVTITSNDTDEPSYTFSVTGTGTAPEINVRQGVANLPDGSGSYDFGTVNADGNDGSATSFVTFTIENLGTATLTLTSTTTSGSDFDQTSTGTSSIAASSSTTFTIRFDPQASGSRSSTVTISSNDADEATYTFTVTGTGTAVPEINVRQGATNLADGSGTYSFGLVTADGNNGSASSYVTFTIENLGTSTLTLSGTSVSGSDFDLTAPLSNSISGGSSTTFTVRFDPGTTGAKSETVTITCDDSSEGTYTFGVTGTGVLYPEINVKQGTTSIPDASGIFDFGFVTADGNNGTASSYITFTIENLGLGTLNISSVGFTYNGSHFDYTNPLSYTVAASSTTTFTIRADPLISGGLQGFFEIVSDDTDEGSYTFTVSVN